MRKCVFNRRFQRLHFDCKLILSLVLMHHSMLIADTVTNDSTTSIKAQQLFDLITKPVPPKLRLLAEIEAVEPGWSKEQVQKMLAKQQQAMKDVDARFSTKDREQIRTSRIKAITASHSGRKLLKAQEWLSGKKYRLDETDFSFIAMDTVLSNKISSGSLPFHRSYLDLEDPSFGPLSYISVNHSGNSATIYDFTNNTTIVMHPRQELWQAFTIEPNLALAFLLACADTNSVYALSNNFINSSMAGLRMDARKLDRLVSGHDPIYTIKVENTFLDSIPVTLLSLRMKSTAQSKGASAEITYWFDQTTGGRLYKVAGQYGKNAHVTSTRSHFDANNFPRLYQTEYVDDNGAIAGKKITFKEVDLHPDFDDAATFSRGLPKNYMVEVASGTTSRLIQDPNRVGNTLQRHQSYEFDLRKTILRIIMIVLLLAPLVLFFTKRKKSKAG
jgi:hypothetical protein